MASFHVTKKRKIPDQKLFKEVRATLFFIYLVLASMKLGNIWCTEARIISLRTLSLMVGLHSSPRLFPYGNCITSSVPIGQILNKE